MNFDETPPPLPRRLRFRSRVRERGASEIAESEKINSHNRGARSSSLAMAGEALAAIYVATARVILLGLEAIEDRRAESRAPVVAKISKETSRAFGGDAPAPPASARKDKSDPT